MDAGENSRQKQEILNSIESLKSEIEVLQRNLTDHDPSDPKATQPWQEMATSMKNSIEEARKKIQGLAKQLEES